MARTDRVQVTVPPLTRMALEHLAKRTGLTPSTQAAVLLKQALARTMESAEVQRAYKARRAQRSQMQWVEDTTNERAEAIAEERYQAALASERSREPEAAV